MSNVLAGIGRAQLEVIEQRVAKRRELNKFYREILEDHAGITFLTEPDERYYSNHWLTAITIDPKKTKGISRTTVRLELEKQNIESRPLWKPMHMQPVFELYPCYVNGTSEALFQDGLCLPSGSNLDEEDLGRIKKLILYLLKK